MASYYKDGPLDSVFSVREPESHRNLKRPVAQLVSMSKMRGDEPYANGTLAKPNPMRMLASVSLLILLEPGVIATPMNLKNA